MYVFLKTDIKTESICRLCIKSQNDKLIGNIKKNIENIIYQSSIESIVHYYHHLKERGRINGENHAERTKSFLDFFDSDENSIEKFFKVYPVLKDIIERKIQDYIKLQEEVISRYIKDKELIESKFGNLGDLNFINHSMGDLHDGKSVCILCFNNKKIVYKPRTALLDIMYNEIISIVAKELIIMKSIEVIEQGNYSWHSYIDYEECTKLQQIYNYYYRVGINLAVFFSLGSSDIHYENIISNGEFPMFIDLETLLHGSINNASYISDFKNIHDSVISTGLLPFESEASIFDFSISGLFTKVRESKKIVKHVLEEDEEKDFIYNTQFVTLEPKNNVTKFNGKEVKPRIVESYLIDGFKKASNYIIKNKQIILSILDKYSKKEIFVRQLLRPTHVYHKFISACEHPESLMSYAAIDKIYRIFMSSFEAGKFGYLRVKEEVQLLKKGYIPYFYTNINSTNLYSSQGIVCRSYFEVSPVDFAIKKINAMSDIMIRNQVRYIKMSIASLNTTSNLIQGKVEKLEKVNLNRDDLVRDLSRYAKRIVEECIEIPDGNAYVNLLIPNGKKLSISPFSYDLYFSLGIVCFLFEYSRIYNDNICAKYAEKLLGAATSKFQVNLDDEVNMDYSLFSGIGGYLFVLYNYYRRTNNIKYKDLVQLALKNIIEYCKNTDFRKEHFDYISGFSGTLYLLQKISFNDKSMLSKNDLSYVEEKYLDSVLKYDKNLIGVGMGHGISGVCLPLSTLSIKKSGRIDLILELLKRENALILKKKLKYTWCRGYTGLILARELLNKNLKEFEADEIIKSKFIPDINEKSIAEEVLKLKNMSLCHGVYGNIDILISLGLYDKYKSIINIKRFKNLEKIKWIRNTDYSWYNFMLGSSGVAYTLLRSIDNTTPSILGLDVI